MQNYTIDIRHQYKTWKILPGFYISDEQPIEIQRIAFLKDQVSSKYSLQLKLRLSDKYINTGLKTVVLQGSLLNSVQDVVYTFTLEYKNIDKHVKYFGTKNIINVPVVADYVRVDSIKFVCNDENSQVHSLKTSSFNQTNIEYSGISESGKYANEVLFKPTRLNNKHWICSCGTLNKDDESCGTCGNTFEQSQLRIDPEHIRQVENIEKSKRAVEKQARFVGNKNLALKIVFGVLILLSVFQLMFDRVPIFLKYDSYDIQGPISWLAVILSAHIVMQIRRDKKESQIESYGLVLQILMILFSSYKLTTDIACGRELVQFMTVDSIYITQILAQIVTLISSIRYSKHQIIIVQILAVLQFILQIVYITVVSSEYSQMSQVIAVEILAVWLQVIMFWAETYLIYFIQLGNRQIVDPTIRFNGIF